MTATADIVTADRQNVLLVPNAAFRFKPSAGGGKRGGITGTILAGPPRRNRTERSATLGRGATQTVYVKGADGTPQPVQVTTGDTNGTLTEVTAGGLQPGQQVITGQLAAGESAGAAGGATKGGRSRGQ
jgi:HlyD family secretion protein